MKKLLLVLLVFVFITSCNYETKPEMVEQIKIGMTSEEVFEIMPGDSTEWDECNSGEYRYGWNFKAPGDDYSKQTFWVIIENGIVINVYTI